jgi:hypothetical protein
VPIESGFDRYLASEEASEQERFLQLLRKKLDDHYPPDCKMTMMAPYREVACKFHAYSIIRCKGMFGPKEVHWNIASGKLNQMKSKLYYINEVVDLFQYLPELLPKNGKKVGLVTGMNGIRNSLEDFRLMGKSITDNLPEQPLFIGLYNPSKSLLRDCGRIGNHLRAEPTEIASQLRALFRALMNILLQVNPELLWLHIAHSEGGAITNRALEELTKEEKKYMKKHLITAAYGPVIPIHEDLAHVTYNTYSKDDYAAKRYGEAYKKIKGYNVDFVDRITLVDKLAIPAGDHAFQGATYQDALKSNIEKVRSDFKIFPRFW